MENIRRLLFSLFEPTWENLIHWVDLALVACVIYQVFKLIRGTRAWRVIAGIVAFVLLWGLSSVLHLQAFHWLLDKATSLGPVALVILLFPELRQALEGVLSFVPRLETTETEARTIEELIAAMSELSATSTGALVVVDRSAQMQDIISNGVDLDAKISAPLLCSIFFEKNPLHDGAVVVRGDKVIAAACRLPLSESVRLDKTLHMRHRAALGAAESFDCVVLVVSEERGTMSMAINGKLEKLATIKDLRDRLNYELRGEEMGRGEKSWRPRIRRHKEEVLK